MVNIIDGKAIAERVKDQITQEIIALNGKRPNLAIVLASERPDSKLYVSLKEREGKKVGVDTHLYILESGSTEAELLEVVNFLNKDEQIDGILVQLPLPGQFTADKIIAAINPEKDADGFRENHPEYVVSPVIASIQACLEEVKFEAEGKKACIFYNSDVFGLSVKQLLEKKGLELLSRENSDQADLLITAMGQPGYIKDNMVKEGAVIIDIGITKVGEKVLGDVDFESVKGKAGFITPVPGGIGPMTIAFLFKNVLSIYKERKK